MEEVGAIAGDNNQTIYDKICQSVVEIVCYQSVPPHNTRCSIPGVITNLGDNYCYIIAYDKDDLFSGSTELIFPDKEKTKISNKIRRNPQTKLVGFCVERSIPHMKAVGFSKEDVSRDDEVFTVGFDMNLPSFHISPGHVTYAMHKTKEYFIHDCPPHHYTSWGGGLVFNKAAKLVGISFEDHGVTYALNVKSITKRLSLDFEGMEHKTLDEILQFIDNKFKVL